MDLLQNDIKEAINLIEVDSGRSNYSKHSKIFANTTENICGYYNNPILDVSNKDIFTVSSSGDHPLNAFLKGAKKVDTFDINRLSKYYTCLKESGVRELPFEDFINFFILHTNNGINGNIFDYNIYKKITRSLDDDVKLFWNSLFEYCENDGIKLRKSTLFDYSWQHFRINKVSNEYLEEKNYKFLQNNLSNKKINFIESDILDLPDKINIDRYYDRFFLSNIADPFVFDNNKEMLYKFRDLILKLSNFLTPEGVIAVAYFYNSRYYRNERSVIINSLGKDSKYIIVDSYYSDDDDYNEDSVVVYKKNRF